MFHLLGYYTLGGVNDANVDMAALADGNFSRRGGATGVNHYIFTEDYQLLADYHQAESALRARWNVPTWNGIMRRQIYPPNRSITVPSNPQIEDLRDYSPAIPINEEIAAEESNNNAAATEDTYVFAWIGPRNWSRALPRGVFRTTARFTAAITTVANTWATGGAITFVDQIKGGTYAVVGCEFVLATLIAARLNFVRSPLYNGRKLTPGCLATEAIGNIPAIIGRDAFGEWGRFNNFELPQVEALANASAAVTIEGRMDMVYLGEGMMG